MLRMLVAILQRHHLTHSKSVSCVACGYTGKDGKEACRRSVVCEMGKECSKHLGEDSK